jgi:hypothetical protein
MLSEHPKKWGVPQIFTKPYNRDTMREYVKKMIDCVNTDSSPGVPLSNVGPTNEAVFDKLGEEVIDMTLNRIENLLTLDVQSMMPKDMIENDCCDPVRLFVKNEPHKIEKLKEGRARLISSVSLVDKLVEMVLNYHVNKQEIANWRNLDYCPGMGFTRGDSSHIYNKAMKNRKVAEADISGWDWSVKDWMIEWDTDFRIRSCEETLPWYHTVMKNRAKCLINSILQLSDGTLIGHPPGLQLSGSFNTSSTNSHIRKMVALLVGALWCFAMGDDSLEDFVDNAKQKYRDLGLVCKDYKLVEKSFDFCSHHYTRYGAYGTGIAKGVMNLLHQPDHLSTLSLKMMTQEVEEELAFNPAWQKCLVALIGMGWYAKILC